MSSIELHEFSANKRVVKTDQFQFSLHSVTASLLNSVGGAGGVVRGWCGSIKFWHGSKNG